MGAEPQRWIVVGDGGLWRAGTCTDRGARPTNEDAHVSVVYRDTVEDREVGLFGVFDGHGGALAAKLCAQHFAPYLVETEEFMEGRIEDALRLSVKYVESKVIEASHESRSYPGTTLTFGVVSENKVFTCNVGDSRVVLGRGTSGVPLTVDHGVEHTEDVGRVVAAGGWIENNRVNGRLSVTRAIGDLDMKAHKHHSWPARKFSADLVSSVPDISVLEMVPEDAFLILACDGVWSAVPNTQAALLVRSALRKTRNPKNAAQTLLKTAKAAGSSDNMSATVVILSDSALEMGDVVAATRAEVISERLRNLRAKARGRNTVHGDSRAQRMLGRALEGVNEGSGSQEMHRSQSDGQLAGSGRVGSGQTAGTPESNGKGGEDKGTLLSGRMLKLGRNGERRADGRRLSFGRTMKGFRKARNVATNMEDDMGNAAMVAK
mmetsp:Transcript_16313/g.40183  ORF Transcript_16313/g.40183 Transcript_16313/m.40183 type:complete len:434 (+) Transcript_16313:228-1529(+)|eukprot:CAMPEP_0198311628 /NCGR_PEP_ID=MMETSP1450-20131203/3290_1 /TAXON_ID=753684 ORGANISM="Madagascaria erythrocladiodes, Strain CCMP3234" /NCGR_SAMPLE_ID=MMETSP1450 /ASSEMBLY_ACC=CAM_ASM_001115 /LENGTH=433 /DNA_ID=CAMNT_0044014529 /DNA_START=220 /DNA_END=1521 /DNA_ORIENTATION=-